MAQKKGGMGKSLDALFIDNAETDNSTVTLPLGDIEPNRAQPRKYFEDEALSELSDSIARYGVLQPLLVRPMPDGSYQIVAGERRWRAARLAGLSEVPVIIKPLSDEEASLIALIENLQRADLNPIEEAQGVRRLMNEYSMTQEEAAEKIGKSRPAVANALRLLALPDAVLAMVEDKRLSAGHARTVLGIKNEEKMISLAEEIVSKGLSVRETEKLVRRLCSEPRQKTEKKAHEESFYTEAELALSNSMGRSVTVKEGKKGGKLIIEFFDKEDLARIAKLLED